MSRRVPLCPDLSRPQCPKFVQNFDPFDNGFSVRCPPDTPIYIPKNQSFVLLGFRLRFESCLGIRTLDTQQIVVVTCSVINLL